MARDFLDDRFPMEQMKDILDLWGEDSALNELLSQRCQTRPKPLVLLIDEIDALVGDVLISVLRQLRAGYVKRPSLFPQSILLCGVRDVRGAGRMKGIWSFLTADPSGNGPKGFFKSR